MDFRTDVEWDRWKISMVWPHFDWDTRLLSHWGLLICRCLISSGMDSYNMDSLYPYACHNCWRLYIHSDLLQVIVNKKVMVRKTCYLFSLVTTWSDFYTRVKTQMAIGTRSFSKDWFFKIKLYGRHLCSQLFYFASRFGTCVCVCDSKSRCVKYYIEYINQMVFVPSNPVDFCLEHEHRQLSTEPAEFFHGRLLGSWTATRSWQSNLAVVGIPTTWWVQDSKMVQKLGSL